ncbi:hypothetical protein VE01_10783 [Pseudogymnoascus verrucosus]|uniref:Uncharacterized protein n=1 Tax=Pseudogymnoascus verrucosus TaxID=342668 RepID=A0A2P6FGW8_9PEZI|nr:uncharacterized protein VE01_10783 [Pseudogymnoascus verrucosus]PQM43887.1 hypothetical protein VE01_10783 [Pseudogymnoascus verrucosus]
MCLGMAEFVGTTDSQSKVELFCIICQRTMAKSAPPYITSKRQTSHNPTNANLHIAYIPPFVTEEDDITVATCNYHPKPTNPSDLCLSFPPNLPQTSRQTAANGTADEIFPSMMR